MINKFESFIEAVGNNFIGTNGPRFDGAKLAESDIPRESGPSLLAAIEILLRVVLVCV